MSPYIISLFISLIISLLICVGYILYSNYQKYEKNWQIFLGILGASVFLCLSITFIIVRSTSYYKEIWNYKIVQINYYEAWNEMVTYLVTVSDGNGKSHTELRTRIDYHPENWRSIDEYGNGHSENKSTFEKYCQIWSNKTFKNLHRSFYSINGNEYYTTWNENFSTIYPYEDIQTYQNKIRVTSSVFNEWQSIDEKTKEKYKHPVYNNYKIPILNYSSYQISVKDIELLRQENANLGKKYEINVILVLFNNTNSFEADKMISAWQGENKNELVICIGLYSNYSVNWCKIYSWMDNTYLHTYLRDELLTLKQFTVPDLDRMLFNDIPTMWHRKHFKDFDYLDIGLSFFQILLIGLIPLILESIGLYFLMEDM